MDSQLRIVRIMIGAVLATMALALVAGTSTEASHPVSDSHTYTLDADFDQGNSINVGHPIPDQLQLDDTRTQLNFIWVAVSSKGTIVKIDTTTGAVLGEYRTAPAGRGVDPSRTTVDNDGNVWVSNRAESGVVAANAIAPSVPPVNRNMGSVTKVGLVENGECVDRNGNGTIETSTGLGDVKPWINAGSADTLGGVSTAEDECILHYTRTNSFGTRHISVTAGNDVWVSGTGGRHFDLIDGATGQIVQQESSVGYGGYGGLIDGNGVIWSARPFLRWDTSLTLTGPNGDPAGASIGPNAAGTNWAGQTAPDSYGLCINPNNGEVWNTRLSGNAVERYAADGTHLGTFPHGNSFAQGCVVDGNGHVWVAHSILNGGQTTVGHLDATGAHLGNVTVGTGPTGVAVDAAGKVWATNFFSRTVSRIDPSLAGGVGAVDFTTVDLGGNLYNYSDMTGSTLTAPPDTGTWTIVHDTTVAAAPWGTVSWTADVPGDSALTVTVESSEDGATWVGNEVASNGGLLGVPDGRYLRVSVKFDRATTDGDGDGFNDSPVLFDLTIEAFLNDPPTADAGGPYDVDEGSSVTLDASGSTDPDGDPLTYAWDLDNDGTYETPGVTASFFGVDGPSVHTVGLEVCDDSNACDSTTVDVTVHNVAPTANAGPDQTVLRNETVSLSGSWTDPAEAADDLYSWAWDVDGDAVDDSFGTASYGDTVPESTSFATAGFYTLTFTVTDKDGGEGGDTLVIEVVNQEPGCDAAAPSIALIWPPNHQFVPVNVLGVTDDDGDAVSVTITSIFQDEPVLGSGAGNFAPDGQGIGTDTAEVRAERSGNPRDSGNGRVYHISFTADDGHGGQCSGVVTVGVPHNMGAGSTPIDEGPLYDSTTS